ncbi:hypothetical protein TrispH2_005786 [Trichoplax sp. H2]|nr:hypothetical protein TrispH2_005786 [Trichoplax sp. H2]|eukprot:RDD42106.1 hypothetical protein TrispH2_005786 [Trichoplax sp. H2]
MASKGMKGKSNLKPTASKGNPKMRTTKSLSASTMGGLVETNTSAKINQLATADLTKIENEYIKNLQQQIYYLELETGYLKDQLQKKPKGDPEMSVSLTQLDPNSGVELFQKEIQRFRKELDQKNAALELMDSERQKLIAQLDNVRDAYLAEKKSLVEQNVSLKRWREAHAKDIQKLEKQIVDAQYEIQKISVGKSDVENRIKILESQIDQYTDENKQLSLTLENKRSECIKLQTKLQQQENQLYGIDRETQEELINELKREIETLRNDLKSAQINSNQDRHLRKKIADDCEQLIKENSALNTQLLELRKKADLDFQTREKRTDTSFHELITLQESEKHNQEEIKRLKESLRQEQLRVKDCLRQLTSQEHIITKAQMDREDVSQKQIDLEERNNLIESENVTLRRDMIMLSDRITSLQETLDRSENECSKLRSMLTVNEKQLSELAAVKQLRDSMQNVKWDEFQKVAEKIQSFSIG